MESRFRYAGVLALILLGVVAAITLVIFLPQMDLLGYYNLEAAMVLAIIAGSAVLLTVLAVVAVIFSYLKLGTKQHALGLPEGSVRAIIAICLIILFVMLSVYLFRNIGPKLRQVQGSYWNGSAFIPVNGTTYMIMEPTEDQVSIANNLVTTVGTLVVALAGFYFGTRAVTVARGGEDRTLTLISPFTKPDEPYLLSAKEKHLEITLRSTPEGESITWETPPEGDKKGNLVQVEPNRFRYTPSDDFKGSAILRFKLSRYPDVKVELKVTRSGQSPASGSSSKKTKSPENKNQPKE